MRRITSHHKARYIFFATSVIYIIDRIHPHVGLDHQSILLKKKWVAVAVANPEQGYTKRMRRNPASCRCCYCSERIAFAAGEAVKH
jgi:hypothetical protein